MQKIALLARPDDHRGLLSMAEAVEAAVQAFTDWANDPLLGELRRRTHTPANVRVTVHQGAAPRYGTTGSGAHAELVRTSGGQQHFPRRGRPVWTFYDAEDGALKLVLIGEMHPTELPYANSAMAMPTACASIAGTHLLARHDCRVAGVFGAGDQARHQLLGLTCVRPSIERVRVYSPTPAKREAFAREMAEVIAAEVVPVGSPREVVEGADVILCATNSNVPVFDGAWLEPGQHVSSIVSSNVALLQRGAVTQMRREVDDLVLERADVLMTNYWPQEELDLAAVFWQTIEQRPHLREKLVDMRQVLGHARPGRTASSQITYFKNCAFWGIAAAALGGLLYQRLLEQGRGVPLDFDPFEYSDGQPIG